MRDSFDAFQYLGHLRARWRFIAAVSGIAAALALVAGLLLPKRYTATTTLVIDPPAGNDPRNATAVSPVYLESLRTYEAFAGGDSLFQRTVDKFKLREDLGDGPLESLKRRVLKVVKPRDTKILYIQMTLGDPRKAQAAAQFIAEETVSLSGVIARSTDLPEANAKTSTDPPSASIEALRAEVASLGELQGRLRRLLADVNADISEYTERSRSGTAADRETARAEVVALEARRATIEKQLVANEQALGIARQRELEGVAGLRGERVKILDPGVVPQRPSFPRLTLMVAVAFGVGLVGAVVWLTLSFRPESRTAESHE